MNSLKFHRLAALLAATMLVAGCSGIQPYIPPDDKETPSSGR
jgi:PBP1b-binding outer membrane lipoprotein LpoB